MSLLGSGGRVLVIGLLQKTGVTPRPSMSLAMYFPCFSRLHADFDWCTLVSMVVGSY